MDTRRLVGTAIPLLVAAAACDGPRGPQGAAADTHDTVPAADPAPPSATPGADPYTGRVVIFMEATPRELARLEAELSEEEYASTADHLMFYRAGAYELLEARGLPVVRLEGRRPLRFLVADTIRSYRFTEPPTLDLLVAYEPGREPQAFAPIDIHLLDRYFGTSGVDDPAR